MNRLWSPTSIFPDFPENSTNASGVLRIDLRALQDNYRQLQAQVAPAEASAVVKANAYGLGAEKVAPALYQAGCRHFFVAHLPEAEALLPVLPADACVYVLNGLAPGAEAQCATSPRITPVCNSREQLQAWAEYAKQLGHALPVVVQIDTGMSRLGLALDECQQLKNSADWWTCLHVTLVMSHLACADEPEHELNSLQLEQFRTLDQLFPEASFSLSNSAGCLLDGGFHHHLVRPGVAIYGVNPQGDDGVAFKPVVSLFGRVVQVRHVEAGAAIGYGATFIAERPMRLATLAMGYADGWSRHLSNCGAAFWNGQRLPITGRVSMDSTIIDISALPEDSISRGDWVELIGPHQSVTQIADQSGTIPYEVLTQLGQRYQRVYVDGEEC